jgi:DNA-binding Xre family transcriptional regulator
MGTTETIPEALAEFFALLDRPPGRVVNRIGRLMAEAGLSQWELARRSGVSIRAVNEIARGLTSRYDAATLAGLCRAFDCGVGDLLVYEPLPEGIPGARRLRGSAQAIRPASTPRIRPGEDGGRARRPRPPPPRLQPPRSAVLGSPRDQAGAPMNSPGKVFAGKFVRRR